MFKTLKGIRGKRLGKSFFDRPTVKVARELLGKYLIIDQAIRLGELSPHFLSCNCERKQNRLPRRFAPRNDLSGRIVTSSANSHNDFVGLPRASPSQPSELFPCKLPLTPLEIRLRRRLTVAKGDLSLTGLIRIGTSQIPMLQNKRFQIGQIIETEAYVGEEDKACHASRGCTPRNKIMWGQAGMLYVYLIYGMYHCLNIVTEQAGFPAAVLIRGLKPISGISGEVNGPGKLCRELGITTKDTGTDITESNKIYINDIGEKPKRVIVAERVGVNYAGEWARKKWRFLSE
jgi:DNA-3-methyladenine glycosylase